MAIANVAFITYDDFFMMRTFLTLMAKAHRNGIYVVKSVLCVLNFLGFDTSVYNVWEFSQGTKIIMGHS